MKTKKQDKKIQMQTVMMILVVVAILAIAIIGLVMTKQGIEKVGKAGLLEYAKEALEEQQISTGLYMIETDDEIRLKGFNSEILSEDVKGNITQFTLDNGENYLLNRNDDLQNKKTTVISSSGYIIEFEDEPIVSKQQEIMQASDIAVMSSSMDDELEQHSNRIDSLHTRAKQDILNIINSKNSQITGNAVLQSTADLPDLKEFKKAFNGISLSLTKEQAKEINELSYVKRVYSDKEVKAFLMDSVPLINADDVWQLQDDSGNYLTGEGVTIGIIDTGVDYTHPDLGGCFGQECKVVGGYDFVNMDNDPMDDYGHGTHCAATAAGKGSYIEEELPPEPNGMPGASTAPLPPPTPGIPANGLNGIAPDAKIYAYKVLDSEGSGSSSDIMEAIERSVDPNQDGDTSDHLDVISLSLGGSGDPDDPMSRAIDNVVDAGVIAVIAAGNSGPSFESIGSPGTARNAITVGATYKKDYEGNYWDDENPRVDQITSFSSRGPVRWAGGVLVKPDVVAPGAIICAAQWQDAWDDQKCDGYVDEEHVQISGTSMATPHVAGAVALLKQKNPDMDPSEIKNLLKTTAIDLGYDMNTQGAGRIDILRAVDSKLIISGDLDFGNMAHGQTTKTKTIKLKNIGDEDISVSLSDDEAVGEDGTSFDALSFDDDFLVIPAGSEIEVSIILDFPLQYDGYFVGRITINDGAVDYSIFYSFSRYSTLHLSVEGDHYPDFHLHDDKIMNVYRAYQWDSHIGNSATLILKSGNYTVYAVNDFINPENPLGNPEKDEYILMDHIEVQPDSDVTKVFSLEDARKFTVKAKSISGDDLRLLEWQRGIATYHMKYTGCDRWHYTDKEQCENNPEGYYCYWDDGYDRCYDRVFGFNYHDPLVGDRDIWLSNLPVSDNGLDTDIILKYTGVPENE